MATDPTLEFLSDLDNPAKFRVKRNVPIWVPHTRVVKNALGNERKIVVKPEDLQAYADNINQLEAERGVVGRITDGHVSTDNPTPEFVGAYRNARVGTFGPKKIPAVLVDCYYRVDKLDIARNRPYRSPEVYSDLKQIRGLALLLKDPFLDMGNVTYNGGHAPVCYGSDHMPEAMGSTNSGLGEAEQKEEHTPEEKDLFEKMRRYMCKQYGLGEDWPKAAMKEDKDGDGQVEADEKKKDVTAMEKGGAAPTLYVREIGELRARIQGMELERQQERCQMLIYGLESKGFHLTDAEKTKEAGKLARLPEAERAERLKELEAIYGDRRAPRGSFDVYQPTPSLNDESDPFAAPWYHEAAVEYMMSNVGTTYEKACQHIQATQQKRK